MNSLPSPREVALELRSMQSKVESSLAETFPEFPSRCQYEKGAFELLCRLCEALGDKGGFGLPHTYSQPSVLFLDTDHPMISSAKNPPDGPIYLLMFSDYENTASEIITALRALAQSDITSREVLPIDSSDAADEYAALTEKFSFRGVPIVYSLARKCSAEKSPETRQPG